MRTKNLPHAAVLLAAALSGCSGTSTTMSESDTTADAGTPAAPVTDEEAAEIAVEAYLYAYPLVLVDVTRRVATNIETPKGAHAPMNQFAHMRAFPDASFTDVVRPNADTLYSSLFFDVSREPIVVTVPESGGRYYLMPMYDLWSDVFASPGTRTTGNGAQTFAIAGPAWNGRLPAGVALIRAPTSLGWVIGRTQTNGKADYDAVHKFQDGISAVPLSSYGKPYMPPKGQMDAGLDMSAPPEQVAKMDAATFFARFAELLKDNPPHFNDYPALARMKRLGLQPGQPFDLAKASPQARQALERAPAAGQKILAAQTRQAGAKVGDWRMSTPPVGTYGADYTSRAYHAREGLGVNVPQDAMYPQTYADAEGKPYDSGRKYVVHFAKGQLPPVRAFWSLTLYNDKLLFADNAINRYAIGDRDALKPNDDGSLTLYVQRESPGKDRESNWLPAPKEGGFDMQMRLYWPKQQALDGEWTPPVVKEAK